MARKRQRDALEAVFRSTERPSDRGQTLSGEGGEVQLPIHGLYRPVGLSLSEGEREYLQRVAEEHKISLHSLMRFLLRWAMRDLMAGRIPLKDYIEPPKEPKAKLRGP